MPRPTQYRARLTGKVAVVTGAGGAEGGDGIGMAIAMLLAGEGASVCVVDNDAVRAEHTRKAIEAEGGSAIVVLADVTDDEACHGVMDATLEAFGALDVLVNNVGVTGGSARLETLDPAVWQRTFDINLKGMMQMSRHAVGPMTAQGGGSIVNIASIAALVSHGTGFAYGASKGGMISLSQDIAVAYGRSGIRSNVICPGHMFTPIVDFMNADQRLARRKVSPLGIQGDAWDIAQAVLFLASDEARFLSGVCLPVDGGVTITAPLKGMEFVND